MESEAAVFGSLRELRQEIRPVPLQAVPGESSALPAGDHAQAAVGEVAGSAGGADSIRHAVNHPPQIPRRRVVAQFKRTPGGVIVVGPDHAQVRYQVRRRLRQPCGESTRLSRRAERWRVEQPLPKNAAGGCHLHTVFLTVFSIIARVPPSRTNSRRSLAGGTYTANGIRSSRPTLQAPSRPG